MKGLAKFFLQNRALSWLLLVLILGGGIFSYYNMGKLEDAPFTIKQAVVTTSYPGASPMEVQQQVTDVLEEAIQSLGELYYLKTDNRAGLSKITVYVKKEIRADEMQQLWDKLRRKVGDVQSKLPAGAGPSVVNDDFGDVLGVFYGLSSETHTYRELEDQAKRIKNELLNVKDVAKVELFGVQSRTIDITVNPALLSSTGVTMADIASAFERQNKVVDAGGLETSSHRLRVEASGSFSSLEELENLTVVSRQGEYFRLGEIAEISESYVRPARNLMKVGNVPAVGIAISTVSDGNPLELYRELPFIETPLYFQGRDTKYGASVTLLQPVYSGGALKAGLEKSRKERESALYEEKRVTNDVLYQADQYYWNKVACEEMVEVAAGFKESVAALVEVVRHRVEEEYTDRNDLLMAEVKLNDAEFRLEQARNEAEVARLSMNSFSGEASDKVIQTDSLVVPLTEVQVYEQTLETAMAHRPELRIAANQVAIQQSAARIANSRYLPKLSVGVDGSYSSPGYDFNSDLDPNYRVYAKLSVPIFEWGKRKNTRRIGKLDVNRALENQSKVADGVRLEVETAYYTYTQAVHQVCLTESSLAKAATSEQLAMDKYKEGTISIVEVLNAQMYHQEAELNHIRSKLRAQLAKSSLERAAGRLGEY